MTDSLPIIRALVAATLLAATATLVLVTVSTARATDGPAESAKAWAPPVLRF